ncbi:hypothetical protein G6F56_013379 [Rhizopus delemar]|nr:hypothetical protein G6F56_013379 [Rhizopus delemar]
MPFPLLALTQHKVTLVTGNAVFAEERRYNNNNTPGRYPNKNAYNTFERRSNNNNNNHRRQGQPPRVNPVKGKAVSTATEQKI